MTSTTNTPVQYLTVDEIIRIHDEMLVRYGGGTPGMFDYGRGRLESMLTRMNEGYYSERPTFPTLIEKVAFQFQFICQYHPFLDGMKRTGLMSAFSFLLRNDFILFSKDPTDSVNFAVRVAGEMPQELDPEAGQEEIEKWFEDRVIYIFDKEQIISKIFSKQYYKCPRCSYPDVTIQRPYCPDCGAQLVGRSVVFDGIVLKREMVIERPTIRDIRVASHPKTEFKWTLREKKE